MADRGASPARCPSYRSCLFTEVKGGINNSHQFADPLCYEPILPSSPRAPAGTKMQSVEYHRAKNEMDIVHGRPKRRAPTSEDALKHDALTRAETRKVSFCKIPAAMNGSAQITSWLSPAFFTTRTSWT